MLRLALPRAHILQNDEVRVRETCLKQNPLHAAPFLATLCAQMLQADCMQHET